MFPSSFRFPRHQFTFHHSPFTIPSLLLLAAFAAPALALTNDFSSNPLTDPSVLVQGPDAPNLNSRFTYNADNTLTAHYDSTAPTLKLLFPLGQHYNQNTSFQMTTTFKINSAGFNSPPDFGASVPAFGLVNSATTGNIRASTGHFDSSFNFVEDTPGNAYDLLTFDYFPTQDTTFGGNSIDLTTIQSAGLGFDNSFKFGFANDTLPLDQFMTVTLFYNALSQQAFLDWGTGNLTADLSGSTFDVDSFAITLWNDPNLNPAPPAEASGSPVGADVVFSSFSVIPSPEPATLTLLLAASLLVVHRRRR